MSEKSEEVKKKLKTEEKTVYNHKGEPVKVIVPPKEPRDSAAYFPATDKTLADINRVNRAIHDEDFGPYAQRVQEAKNAWKRAEMDYNNGKVGSSAVRAAAEKYDKIIRIARGQESEE